MELKGYFQTVWKWWWLIVLGTLCAALASFLATSIMLPVYEAKVILMSGQPTNTAIMDYSTLSNVQQVNTTFRELLQTQPVLEAVIAKLNLPYSPQTLATRVSVKTVPDTLLLELRVEDNDAQRAANIANEMAHIFLQQQSTERQTQEIEGYEQAVVTQMKAVEQAIEETQREMGRLQASSGLSGTASQTYTLPSEVIEQLQAASSLSGSASQTYTLPAGVIQQLQAVADSSAEKNLATLQVNESQQRTAYVGLLSQYLSIRAMKSRLLNIVIAEPASPPRDAIRPRKVLYSAVAAASGFMIACVLAFLLEYLNDTIKTSEDVSQVLGLDTLGVVGRLAKGEDELVVVTRPLSPVAEAFHALRTNIRFSGVDKPLRTLLVTSSSPAEGKSLTVANLAAAMAQTGLKVVAVDADLRHPRLHRLFGLEKGEGDTGKSVFMGLTGSLLEGSTNGNLQPAQVEGLKVLPSGELPPNPAELAGSRHMQELLHELAQQADVVLLDSPPVLPVADAAALAQTVDGVLLVVEAGFTRRETVRRAVNSLLKVNANLIGVVLNAVPTDKNSYYYYPEE